MTLPLSTDWLLSLHLEETENPATNTVVSVALSSLCCGVKIRS